MNNTDTILKKLNNLESMVEDNSKKLDLIISYINYINSKAHQENVDDFGRNILANILSNKFNNKQ